MFTSFKVHLLAAFVSAAPLIIQVADKPDEKKISVNKIGVHLEPAEAKLLQELTTKYPGHVLEIKQDGKTLFSPVIKAPITTGDFELSFK